MFIWILRTQHNVSKQASVRQTNTLELLPQSHCQSDTRGTLLGNAPEQDKCSMALDTAITEIACT